MRRVDTCAAVALALSMAILQSACFLPGKPKTVAAAVPPPPQPTVASTPQTLPQLSVPQTQVQLPPEQPVNVEGIPPAIKAEEPAPTPAPARPTRRPAPTQPKPETPPATPPVAAATPPAEEVAPVQEVLSPEARSRFQESVKNRRGEIRQLLTQVRRPNSDQKQEIKSIESLLEQCDAAAKRGDLREADALAERALVLARELAGGK
jgi:hypothetical protein